MNVSTLFDWDGNIFFLGLHSVFLNVSNMENKVDLESEKFSLYDNIWVTLM